MPTLMPTSRALSGALFRLAVSALAAHAAFGSASAQAASGEQPRLLVEPMVSLTQTVTDNSRLQADKTTDAVTQLTASLRMLSRSGRIQGSLDYALNGFVYARGNGANNLQNSLNAITRIDVVDNWFSVDGTAAISQQTVSAFGVQGIDSAANTSNRTELRSFQLSPNWRGSIAGVVDYKATISHGASRSDAPGGLGDSTSTSARLAISGRQRGPLGWTATLSRRQFDYDTSRLTEEDSVGVSLNYVATPELQLSSSIGRESTNLTTFDKEASTTWGFGVDWTPTPRTRLSAQQMRRGFGSSHNLSLEHRMSRTVFLISSSRDITDPTSPGSSRFNLDTDRLLAEIRAITDPVLRNQISRELGFLFASPTLQSRTHASVRYEGVRTSLSAIVATSSSRRLDPLALDAGDLGQTDNVKQRIYSLGLGHRLTPVTRISLDLSRQTTSGRIEAQSNELKSLSLTLSTAAGPRANASLSARHAVFDSLLNPYTENAVVATYGLKF